MIQSKEIAKFIIFGVLCGGFYFYCIRTAIALSAINSNEADDAFSNIKGLFGLPPEFGVYGFFHPSIIFVFLCVAFTIYAKKSNSIFIESHIKAVWTIFITGPAIGFIYWIGELIFS